MVVPALARAAGSVLPITTVPVTLSLVSSTSASASDPVTFNYYGNQGSWQPAVTTSSGSTVVELLPVPGFVVQASYHGADQALAFDASSSTAVTFHTVAATFGLVSSSGSAVTEPVTFNYYGNRGAWQPAVTTSSGSTVVELLPVAGFVVQASYHGADQALSLDASTASSVTFHTTGP
jgi:O-antigen ligase